MSFSPFSYLFISCYFLILIVLPSLTSFYVYWFIIELMILFLMGVAYTLITNNISSLMMYFFIQSVASFNIFIGYVIVSPYLLTLALLLKLGMFPFVFWYFRTVIFFPNSIFFLVSSFHKLPPLLIVYQFDINISYDVFWASVLITILLIGCLMLFSSDFRLLLTASSVANNAWIILSLQSGAISFISFVVVYFLTFFFLMNSVSNSYLFPTVNLTSQFLLVSLSGLPPFPLFFINVFIFMNLFYVYGFFYLPLLLLLLSSAITGSYIVYLIEYIIRYDSI